MGYALCVAQCYGCRGTFGFNPHKVPSVKDDQGIRQPICGDCVKVMQEKQRKMNVPVWPDPLPGAYEGLPEEDL